MNSIDLHEALLKIRNDPQFKPVVAWLTAMRETARDRMELTVDGFQVEQGKARMAKTILDSIQNAPEVLQKLK